MRSLVMLPLCLSQHLSAGSGFDSGSVSDSLSVNASFQQTLWSVAPIYCGGGIAQGRFNSCLLQPSYVIV